MKRPRLLVGHPDRFRELEEHLEPSFMAIVEVALAVGYSEQEALAAIASLVDTRLLEIASNPQAGQALNSSFWRRRHQ